MGEGTIHRLKAHGFDLAVDAERGASLLYLRWQKADGRWIEILHSCPPAVAAQTGGSFVMAPFANRLDRGAFVDGEGRVEIPLNRPDQDMAVHGSSRDRAWQVLEATGDALTLVDEFHDPDIRFDYRLEQRIGIEPAGVRLSLRLTNTAGRTLPYGLGFHPWFRKEEDTWLTFRAGTAFDRDDRGFPIDPTSGNDGAMFAAGVDVSRMPWFDGHFSEWASRTATVEWRAEQVRLTLSATGALTNLHVYVPDDRPVLCVEPVSHVPDVHNRRRLKVHGDVAWLATGEVLEGSMFFALAGAAAVSVTDRDGNR